MRRRPAGPRRLPNSDRYRPSGYPAIATRVVLTGGTIKLSDGRVPIPDVPFDARVDSALGGNTAALVTFPLPNHAGEIVGVVVLTNGAESGRRFADEYLGLLARFNRLVGTALERADILERIGNIQPEDASRNARLRDQAEELARLDDDGDEAFRMVISMLARATEIHDEGTANHVFRVNEFSHFLGQTVGLDDATCRELRYSAQLHNVGKMGVASAVLRKTGPLSEAERREMDNHTIYGHRILSR